MPLGDQSWREYANLADDECTSYPWKLLPKNLNIDKQFLSKYALCREENPECVAFDKDDKKQKVKYPAHWHCTIAAEDQADLAGFNPILYLDD